jgi:DNA-directed RNA polymerase II subunit RPB2
MEIVEKIIKKYTLIPHQYESFHDFVYNGIRNVIYDEPTVISYQGNEIIFNNIRFEKPSIVVNQIKKPLYPAEVRRQSINYKFDILIDVEIDNVKSTINFASLPCMVGSKLCNLYNKSPEERYALGEIMNCPGGHFILNGKERVIIAQGRKTYNKFLCYRNSFNDYICEMRSYCEETVKSNNIVLKFNKKLTDIIITVDKQNYNLSVLLKEFGYIEDFKKSLGTDHIFLEEIMYFMTEDSEIIGGSFPDISQMFPHLRYSNNRTKIIFLGKMSRKLCLTYLKILIEDDKSHLSLQRLDSVGVLCKDIFKKMWKQFIKALTKDISRRHKGNIYTSINGKKSTFTKQFQTCFCTSSWGVDKNSYKKEGVSEFSQYLNSYLNHCSILKKINKSIGKKDKNIKGRLIEPSSEYYVCNYETPEGQAVGSKLALTILTNASLGSSNIIVQELIEKFLSNKYQEYLNDYEEQKYLVQINGFVIGNTNNPEYLVQEIRKLRSNGFLNKDISVHLDIYLKVIEIWCDPGRYIRPLLNAKKIKEFKGKLLDLSVEELEDLDILVYRDPLELETTYVGTYIDQLTDDMDYVEIHPICMMGLVSGEIVFSNHAQAPRISYMSSMRKQAIGYIPSRVIRTDNTVYSLDYTQRPLVSSKLAYITGSMDFPDGINAIVAIACLEGFNQEDSVILNKGSIDRGMFTMVCYMTISVDIKITGGREEILCIPEKKYRIHKNYNKITDSGLPKIGTRIEKGDVIVGKIKKEKKSDNEFIIKDDSYTAKLHEYGTICEINILSSSVKITLKQQKIPELGDKFCSGMAQKGTCGMIYPEEDMPYTAEGIKPDIIINPHCLPSRMTINQLIACINSKARCISGDPKYEDGTPFSGLDNTYDAMKILKENGFNEDGTETLYNGMTGKKFIAKIMIGPTYYHRLPHFVEKKMYAASHTVSRNILTKQPNEGRSKEGGLKFGEMEKDVKHAHGTVAFLNEKMVKLSDYYVLPVCGNCKNYNHIIKINSKNNIYPEYSEYEYVCGKCKTMNISMIELSYATKVMLQLLVAIGLKINIS